MIILTGKIHNRIEPFNGFKTMGCYVMADAELTQIKKLSVETYYRNGTMASLTLGEESISIKKTSNPDDPINTFTKYKQFLLPLPVPGAYHAVFFTRRITASSFFKTK